MNSPLSLHEDPNSQHRQQAKWLFRLIGGAVIGLLVCLVPLTRPKWFGIVRAVGLGTALLGSYAAAGLSLWDLMRVRSRTMVIAAILSVPCALAVTLYLFYLFRSDV